MIPNDRDRAHQQFTYIDGLVALFTVQAPGYKNVETPWQILISGSRAYSEWLQELYLHLLFFLFIRE